MGVRGITVVRLHGMQNSWLKEESIEVVEQSSAMQPLSCACFLGKIDLLVNSAVFSKLCAFISFLFWLNMGYFRLWVSSGESKPGRFDKKGKMVILLRARFVAQKGCVDGRFSGDSLLFWDVGSHLGHILALLHNRRKKGILRLYFI